MSEDNITTIKRVKYNAYIDLETYMYYKENSQLLLKQLLMSFPELQELHNQGYAIDIVSNWLINENIMEVTAQVDGLDDATITWLLMKFPHNRTKSDLD